MLVVTWQFRFLELELESKKWSQLAWCDVQQATAHLSKECAKISYFDFDEKIMLWF
jgi:hypothetical protein